MLGEDESGFLKADQKARQAAEKIRRVGKLGITGDDWEAVGGTVPPDLKQNPGKTRAELMSDQEVAEYLRRKQGVIQEFSQQQYRNSTFHQSFVEAETADWNATTSHLRSIGRLPKEFETE